MAQETPVPGVLSGVGTDATRGAATALNNAAALQSDAATPQLAPPGSEAFAAVASAREVSEIVFTGDTAFAEKQKLRDRILDAVSAGATVGEAFRTIHESLIHDGFYLARLSPDYNEASKTLTVRVETGAFGDKSVVFINRETENGRWFSKRQIERRFADLAPGDTFNYRQLYRRLSEVNASPDLTLDTHITVRAAADDDGQVMRYADLGFTVKERFPFHAMLEVNNYATEELGDWQAQLTLQYLNLTRADDVLTLSPGMSLNGDLLTLAGSYMRPHHLWKGGATTLYGGYSQLDSKDIVPRIDLEGTGWFGGLMESFKLVDNDSYLLSLSAGLMYRYVEDQFTARSGNESLKLQKRNVSVLPLTVSLAYSDRSPDFLRGRNFAALSGIYNIWAGGDNTLEEMWYGAPDHYTIARLQLARLQPLFGFRDAKANPIHQWTLFLKAEGQYSPDPLIPAEKLFLGGFQTVRGYTTKSVLGDSGVYASAEFRTPILLDTLGQFIPFGKEGVRTPLDRIQFLVFLDAGYAQQEDPLPGSFKNEKMLSCGAGMRFALTSYSQFRFDYGIPLVKIDSDENNSSGMFYVSGQLQF